MESAQSLYTNYTASMLQQQQEEIEIKITDWASQHPLFKQSYWDPNNKEIITAFYKAKNGNDPDSLYKAGEYCRDHPELKLDVQAIFFFHGSIEERYKAKQADSDTARKIQAAQDNLDNMLLEGRGISEFDPKSIDRKVRDYCLGRLGEIERNQSDSRAVEARYQIMDWYLRKSDFVGAVNYFSLTDNGSGQFRQVCLQALISLLTDNPPGMKDWDEKKLKEYSNKRAHDLMHSRSGEHEVIWSKNRLSIYKKCLEFIAQQGDVSAELQLLKLNAEEDPRFVLILSEFFNDGNSRLGLEPDQFKSQKYLVMAAEKNHMAAMQKYLTLWRGDKLLPEFNDIKKAYDYEDQIQKDKDYIDKAVKDVDDVEAGRLKPQEYS